MPRAIMVFAAIWGVSLGCDSGDDARSAEHRVAAAHPAEAVRPGDPPQPVSAVPAITVSAPADPTLPSPAPRRTMKPARLTIEDALASLRAAGLEIRDRAECDAAPVDAAECCDVAIDGARAEISRYDLRVEKQRQTLERRAAAGEVERFGPFAVKRVEHPRMPSVRQALSTFAAPETVQLPERQERGSAD